MGLFSQTNNLGGVWKFLFFQKVTLKVCPNGKTLSEEGVGDLYFYLFLRVEAGIYPSWLGFGRIG